MTERRNIIVVGASEAGLQATHYILKHILPALKSKKEAEYHVYNINPSSSFFFRIAAPRVSASASRLAPEKIFFDLHESFKQYSSDDFTFIEAFATGLDTTARTIAYRSSKASEDEHLPYHALIVATGSRAPHGAFSSDSHLQDTLDAIASVNVQVQSAKSIIIVGGGPTAVEFAGEVAEHRNGKPGWFSKSERNAKITLVTAAKTLLSTEPESFGKKAERKLNALGVDVLYSSRVTSTATSKEGLTTVTLGNGKILEAEFYMPASGVSPNSSWLPPNLLDEKNYLITNDKTTRVDMAGPRVYGFGDIASWTHNNVWDIVASLPALAVNLKRDLMSYNALLPDAKPKGKDREVDPKPVKGIVVPIGSGGGVGQIMGWRLPSFFVWLMKSRDFLVGMSGIPTSTGDSVKKEFKWSAEEAAI